MRDVGLAKLANRLLSLQVNRVAFTDLPEQPLAQTVEMHVFYRPAAVARRYQRIALGFPGRIANPAFIDCLWQALGGYNKICSSQCLSFLVYGLNKLIKLVASCSDYAGFAFL